jgi:hypothetical protein
MHQFFSRQNSEKSSYDRFAGMKISAIENNLILPPLI